jgi:hypothetical protein
MADTTKLKTFLDSNKLNGDRLLAVSHKLETLTTADRRAKLDRVRAKKGAEGGASAEGEKKEAVKPRSGRPVTPRALASALAGKEISGPTKQRILRAVNYLLEQKKKDKVDLKAIF